MICMGPALASDLSIKKIAGVYKNRFKSSIDPPPIKESMLDRYFAIHNGNFTGGILDGEEISYGGADYREAASG